MLSCPRFNTYTNRLLRKLPRLMKSDKITVSSSPFLGNDSTMGIASIILIVVSLSLAIFPVIGIVITLSELRAGHLYAGSDPAGFGMGLGYILIASLGGMACAVLAILAEKDFHAWGIGALAVHAVIFLLTLIASEWNVRLEAKAKAKADHERSQTKE